MYRLAAALLSSVLLSASFAASAAPPRDQAPFDPAPMSGLDYDKAFFPGADYDPAIPDGEKLLGFELGERTASPAEIVKAYETWAEASPRATLVEYARSFEGRPLVYMVITSPENQQRLDEIKAGLAKIADPRKADRAERERLVESLPGVAWLAYSIHGNETSGSDAALVTAHHLVADRSEETTKLLDELVVILDPSMNPDGRARFYQQMSEYRGMNPNVDDQSLVHSGYWPSGRMSHYMFDLNRDWIFGTHPETRGRIKAVSEWHPQLFVDAHEMGAQDTYLFSPAREPHNPHFMPNRDKWATVFAKDQAAAFDEYNWPYYHGEWNEGWFPGYSDAWASFRGAQGILYEQARMADDGVRQANGEIVSYQESVHHQALSSLANLETLRENRRDMLREFHADRVKLLSNASPYGNRVFAITPTENRGRIADFMDLMELQGFEVYRTKAATTQTATDQFGETRRVTLPAGTLLIPNRQPEARLVAAMLEFDPTIPESALQAERKALVKDGSSTIYDTTAWNITMMFGLEAYEVDMSLPGNAEQVEGFSLSGDVEDGEDIAAWVINGMDDRAVAAAGRLMERGVKVRITDKTTTLSDIEMPRGTLVINPYDNRGSDDTAAHIAAVAEEFAVDVDVISTGLGKEDLPDLGGGHFRLLERPRVALLARGSISPYDFGSTWYTLDTRLGLRNSHINNEYFTYMDLRRYNVLVLPDRWGGSYDKPQLEAIKQWVENGGTLIAIGGSARAIASEDAGISQVRQIADTFENLDPYRTALLRDWMSDEGMMPGMNDIWAHSAPEAVDPPWVAHAAGALPSPAEMKRRDEWQGIFMPQGALMAATVDDEHWLTFGNEGSLPVLYGNAPVLMAPSGVDVPLRMGKLASGDGRSAMQMLASAEEKASNIGWAPLPAGHELNLRMSGLVWPEAAQRIANSAYVTRERVGKGQVILFADTPTMRGATLGTSRILENAIVYGPGLGTQPLILP